MTTVGTTTTMVAAATPRITLFIFPPVPHVYNMSPFGLKVESYLRVNKIEYNIKYTTTFSSKRQIPYIRIRDDTKDEEEVPDSNVIVTRLQCDYPSTDFTLKLTPAQHAITRMCTRMLDEHTCQIGFHYRYGRHINEFFGSLDIKHRFYGSATEELRDFVATFWKQFQPIATLRKSEYRGLTRHSDEELWDFSTQDLQALEQLLMEHHPDEPSKDDSNNSKPYFFFGHSQATYLDCTVFGHISQFYYIPIGFPQEKYMKEHCPRLCKFMDAFRHIYWPDWEQKCQIPPAEQCAIDHSRNLRFLRLHKMKRTAKMVLVAATTMAGVLLVLRRQRGRCSF